MAAKVFRRARELVRLARDIRGFLATPVTPEMALEQVSRGVANRESRFLRRLESGVYGNPRSPFLKLLAHCGCEFGDAEKLVRNEGLDAALRQLAAQGVYLTFEEFKCRVPVTRGNQTFTFAPEDFANPSFRAEKEMRTGGSSGAAMKVGWAFGLTEQWAPYWCLFFEANGLLADPLILWTPGNSGSIGPQLACAKFGRRLDHWFVSQQMTLPADRLYAEAKHWICRVMAGFPHPVFAPYQETGPVLECVRRVLGERGKASLNTMPSAAVRLSCAARERGVSLRGLTFLLGGEALTPTRRESIEASGAVARPLYGSTEAVWTGGQCPEHQEYDEVHVLRDLHAVIAQPDPEEAEHPVLLFTVLAPLTPLITLNTDIGDRGVITDRDCGCLYARAGCRQMIHTIRSSDKITGFGVTIWVADVQAVIEGVLPREFGGAAEDYQVVEARTAAGLPEYWLIAHPRLGPLDESALAGRFFDALASRKSYYGFMTGILRREGVLRVKRQARVENGRGKVLPFCRVR